MASVLTDDSNAFVRHAGKVERICEQLRHRTSTAPLSLRKTQVSHHVPKLHDKRRDDDRLDVSALDEIIIVDAPRRLCIAEPGVPFDRLVSETLRYGLVPKVVPELRTITIGGAVSGCSIESMSFRYGGFHDNCVAYEIISARGDVVRCTREHDALLFDMMQNSFGTLGILSLLTFVLVPAKPCVHVVYERYTRREQYLAALVRHAASDVDFIDGIIHSPQCFVLSLGRFVDDAPYTNAYDWTKVYYVSTLQRTDDYLRTFDYFFRYDRGVTNVHPKTFLGRLLLGKLLTSSQLLGMAERFHRFLPKTPDVTVDVFVPLSRWDGFMEWYGRTLGHFPLWMVPYRRAGAYPWLASDWYAKNYDQLYIDIAIYGAPQRHGVNFYKLLEDELLAIGGMKTLISHNYYSREDFWKTFNRPNYERIKQRMDPDDVFRDLYDKMCRAAQGR